VAQGHVENEATAVGRQRRILRCADCGTHWRVWEHLSTAKWYAAQPVTHREVPVESRSHFRFRRAQWLDIDRIITDVHASAPKVAVTQWCQSWPADDDSLWFFDLVGQCMQGIQIEGSFGQVPFCVETPELCCEQARWGKSVAEVVSMILEYVAERTGA
jgi:hypothetical protein